VKGLNIFQNCIVQEHVVYSTTICTTTYCTNTLTTGVLSNCHGWNSVAKYVSGQELFFHF